jgi:hypothetical protein
MRLTFQCLIHLLVLLHAATSNTEHSVPTARVVGLNTETEFFRTAGGSSVFREKRSCDTSML